MPAPSSRPRRRWLCRLQHRWAWLSRRPDANDSRLCRVHGVVRPFLNFSEALHPAAARSGSRRCARSHHQRAASSNPGTFLSPYPVMRRRRQAPQPSQPGKSYTSRHIGNIERPAGALSSDKGLAIGARRMLLAIRCSPFTVTVEASSGRRALSRKRGPKKCALSP